MSTRLPTHKFELRTGACVDTPLFAANACASVVFHRFRAEGAVGPPLIMTSSSSAALLKHLF